jgi:hypothetical protein
MALLAITFKSNFIRAEEFSKLPIVNSQVQVHGICFLALSLCHALHLTI